MRVVNADTPTDEYSPEAEAIATALAARRATPSTEEIQSLLRDTFAWFFAPLAVGDQQSFAAVAEEIIPLVQP